MRETMVPHPYGKSTTGFDCTQLPSASLQQSKQKRELPSNISPAVGDRLEPLGYGNSVKTCLLFRPGATLPKKKHKLRPPVPASTAASNGLRRTPWYRWPDLQSPARRIGRPGRLSPRRALFCILFFFSFSSFLVPSIPTSSSHARSPIFFRGRGLGSSLKGRPLAVPPVPPRCARSLCSPTRAVRPPLPLRAANKKNQTSNDE